MACDRRSNANVGISQRHRYPSTDVELYVVDDFFNAHECDMFTTHMRCSEHVQVSRMFDGGVDPCRTSSSCKFYEHCALLEHIGNLKMAKGLGVSPSRGEGAQGSVYRVGQQFKPHMDGHVRRRAWTCIVYLNDVVSGGHTEFPRAHISIMPRKGRAIFWNNCMPGSDVQPNPNTVHAGRPILEGEKYILMQFYS
jgi:prolyl 4-hydroxylase